MNVINIKNGILLDYTKNYSIYEMYTEDAKTYYMCIANYETNKFETVLDFPEEYFMTLRNEEKIEEIKKTCDSLYDGTIPYLYILPNVTTYDISEAEEINDNHAYQVLLRRLQKYTYNIYKNITNNNSNIEIDQTIKLIIDTETDKKFLDFLDINGLNSYFIPMYLERSLVKQNEEVITTEEVKTIEKQEDKPKTRTLKNDNDFGYSNLAFIAVGMVIGVIIFIYIFLYK